MSGFVATFCYLGDEAQWLSFRSWARVICPVLIMLIPITWFARQPEKLGFEPQVNRMNMLNST